MKMMEHFKQRKQDLKEKVADLQQLVSEDLQGIEVEKLHAFAQELERDLTFNILCVGDFSSGKTTFVNNFLIGDDILPARARPTTIRLTEVHYGEVLRASILDNQGEVKTITENVKEVLGDYVAAEGSHADTTERVLIESPSEALSDGVVVIDAPGLNDPDAARMKVTLDYLHQADAVLYFFNAQQAWTKSQKEFLEESILGKNDLDKLFLMLNYWDCIEDDQREELLEYVNEEIHRSLASFPVDADHERLPIPALLPISAKTGENIELVQEKVWHYLSSCKEKNVLAYKIQRFNTYIKNYIGLVEDRITLAQSESHTMAEKKASLEQELEVYKKVRASLLKRLKIQLENELEVYRVEVEDLILSPHITKSQQQLEAERLKGHAHINRRIASLLSQQEHQLTHQLKGKSHKLRKKLTKIIQEWQSDADIPLFVIGNEDDFFAALPIPDQDKNIQQKALKAGEVTGGLVALGSAGFLVNSAHISLAASWYSSPVVFAASAALYTPLLVLGGGAALLLHKHRKDMKSQEIQEMCDQLVQSMQQRKYDYISQLFDKGEDMLNDIIHRVDHDVNTAYYNKLEDIKNIKSNSHAEQEAAMIKTRLQALTMEVN